MNYKKTTIKRSNADLVFDLINYSFFTVILLLILYPIYFILIASFSDPTEVLNGNLRFWIKGFQLEGYSNIFGSSKIWKGYGNSILYTVSGTAFNIILTMMAGYSIAQKSFKARKIIMLIFVFTMYFNGGLIPTYLLVDSLELVGRRLVMIILGAVSVWNLIISRTFIATSIPRELYDAAMIDGCDHFKFLFKIVFPLSKALIAVLCLYYGLEHWNTYFKAMIYLKNPNHYPLQIILREILVLSEIDLELMPEVVGLEEQMRLTAIMKYGLIIVASIPMLMIYPFLQKYFVKGVMLGSLKG